MAAAAKMMKMNVDAQGAVVQVLEAAQENMKALAAPPPASAAISIFRCDYRPSAVSMNLMASPLAHSAGPASVATSQPFLSISKCGRHAEGAAFFLQFLEDAGGRIGIIGERADAGFLQPGLRLLRVAGVDIDRHHLEIGAAELLLQFVERRHLLLAGRAPGRPQVQQHGLVVPVGELALLSGAVAKGEIGKPDRALWRAPAPPPRRGPAAAGSWPEPRPGGRLREPPHCASPRPSRIPPQAPRRCPQVRPEGSSAGAFSRSSGDRFAQSWKTNSLGHGHEQQDVGRAVFVEPRRDHGGDQRLHRRRPAPLPTGHRREQGPCRHAGAARHHYRRGRKPDSLRSGHDFVRDRAGQIPVPARARRRAHERRIAARRIDRRRRRPPAYRALAQRSGRDRF